MSAKLIPALVVAALANYHSVTTLFTASVTARPKSERSPMAALIAALVIGTGMLLPARVQTSVRRPRSVRMTDPAVQSASRLLGRMIASSSNQSRPTRPKPFIFGASGSHTITVDGTELTHYMQLPVEEYVLYDEQYMQRVTTDTFELRLPVAPGAASRDALRPWLRVRVAPGADSSTLSMNSVGANLLGFDDEQSGNGTTTLTNLESMLRTITANFSAVLAWDTVSRGRGDARSESTRLRASVRVGFGVSIGTPLPRLLVQGAVNILVGSAMRLALPQFLTLLQRDFERWRNGTREAGASVGSLVEPGQVIVLDEGSRDQGDGSGLQ